MESISIQTSQNVAIDQAIASIGERIAAALLDISFFLAYFFVIMFVGAFSGAPKVILFLTIPVAFYHLASELLMNGQSWGKKIVKIRVTNIDGTKPGFFAYLLRWIFRLIDVTLLFGSISTVSIILSKNGQRLGDMAANTIVIRVKNTDATDTLFTRLPEDFTLNYPEVNKLTDSDIYTVKEVLQFLKKSVKSQEAMVMADQTKRALEKKMGVEAGIRSEHFLFKILRDYNYIHSGKNIA